MSVLRLLSGISRHHLLALIIINEIGVLSCTHKPVLQSSRTQLLLCFLLPLLVEKVLIFLLPLSFIRVPPLLIEIILPNLEEAAASIGW